MFIVNTMELYNRFKFCFQNVYVTTSFWGVCVCCVGWEEVGSWGGGWIAGHFQKKNCHNVKLKGSDLTKGFLKPFWYAFCRFRTSE